MDAKKLPPTNESFTFYLLLCMYQLYIWERARISKVDVLWATQFGYEKGEDG